MATLYFAYGSNMASSQLAAWGTEHRALGPAELRDHRLAFLRRSIRWQAGAADIVRARGESVWGVLWELPFGAAELDRKEAAGDAYRRRAVEVLHAGEAVTAMAYEVIEKEPEEVPPRPEYLDLMLAGAREHGLPEAWLARLQAISVSNGG
ncbi:MAG TPA: gamma-glutamylcyclotransferase family protein [Thermoleophilaceae bacterium]